MRITLFFLTLVLSFYEADASSKKIGVSDFNIIKLEKDITLLQVEHLFLGRPSEKAYFLLSGCKDGTRKMNITNNYFSTFEMEECIFEEKENIFIELYYVDGGIPKKFESFFSKNEILDDKTTFIAEGVAYLGISGVIEGEGKKTIITYGVSDRNEEMICSTSFDILVGHNFLYSCEIPTGYDAVYFIYENEKYFVEFSG